MKKGIFAGISLSLFLALGCSGKQVLPNPEMCITRYPVVFVHGIGFRDKTGVVNYWGDTISYLKGRGAKVYLGEGEAFGTVETNAGILRTTVGRICAETGAEKVNIIAHSRGGIEARYMISSLGMAHRVASLTTIATPHRGSPMADLLVRKSESRMILDDFMNFYALLLGDDTPSSYKAGVELTTWHMAQFNLENPDMPGVKYQSYAGFINESYPNPIWRKMASVIAEREGANDGLVSVESAKWGDFRGVVTCDEGALVSHSDIIGMHFVSWEFCFDAPTFYRDVIQELKMRGY